MNRKIKALGLALVAALALTAVMASTASAQFTSSNSHTIISGSQKTGTNDVFTAGEGFGGITCENATFSGTATTAHDPDQTVFPTYSGCKDTFGRTLHIDNSNLTYTFTRTGKDITVLHNGKSTLAPEGEVDIGGSMTLTVTSNGSVVCVIEIKSGQTNNGITFYNLGGTSGIETTTRTTNVITATTGGFFNCGVANGEHKNGTYDGVAIVNGKDTSGAAASISVD